MNGPGADKRGVVHDLRARLVFLSECLEDGDYPTATAIVLDLLDELGGPACPSGACPVCGLAMWPGQIPGHLSVVHHVDPAERAA